jgi:hypothetical protein
VTFGRSRLDVHDLDVHDLDVHEPAPMRISGFAAAVDSRGRDP